MSTLTLAARLVGGVILLFANGFFVGTEFAMTRIRQFDQSQFDGDPRLERAWDMTERLEIYLSGCQVGITVASVGLGVVAEPAVAALVSDGLGLVGITSGGHTALSVVLALGVINMLHVIIGEQTPTYLGVERTRWVARHGARWLYYWTLLMSPFIRAADWTAKWLLGLFGVDMTRSWVEAEEETLSRAEIRREMGTVLGQSELTEERREEIIAALEIGDTTVGDVMVPREDIVALRVDDDVETTLETMESHPHVRFPLVGDSLEDFRGIVYSPAIVAEAEKLLDGSLDFEDVAAPPMTVAPDTSVSDLIDQFQAQSQELALVLDGGEVVGLVTQTDAVEEITGELRDPLDR